MAHVTPRKALVPILDCARLELTGAELAIYATDIDRWRKITLPIEGLGGLAAVAAVRLESLRAASPAKGSITLEFAREHLTVRHASGRARLSTMPGEDFPLADTKDQRVVTFDLDGEELAGALKRVTLFASQELSRYYLCGAFMEVTGEALNADGIGRPPIMARARVHPQSDNAAISGIVPWQRSSP